jgi:hypothetical protein
MTARFLVVLALVQAVAITAPACGHSPQPADLVGPGTDGQWYTVSASAEVDEAQSFGSFIALAQGTRHTVTVRSIRLTGVHGLEVLGVRLNGPGRGFGTVGSASGFPAPQVASHPAPLPGAVVPAEPSDARQRCGVAWP